MIIGYRRVAGKLPLTANETGQRGTWLEKRTALRNDLTSRGHQFKWLSNPTTASAPYHQRATDNTCDLLMLEFGGTNLSFYGKDWAETTDIIQAHRGPIIYLCDDPDLPFLWNLLPHENWSRWTIAVNAVNLGNTRTALGVPAAAKITDLPFHGGMTPLEFTDAPIRQAIYYGRPNGRTRTLLPYLSSGLVTVAGREKDWTPGTPLVTPPEQKDRQTFYRQYQACLAVYDQKHAITGWRTGRAYHALNAGIPVTTPTGNPALNWAWQLNGTHDLVTLLKASPESRRLAHKRQLKEAYADLNPIYESLNL